MPCDYGTNLVFELNRGGLEGQAARFANGRYSTICFRQLAMSRSHMTWKIWIIYVRVNQKPTGVAHPFVHNERFSENPFYQHFTCDMLLKIGFQRSIDCSQRDAQLWHVFDGDLLTGPNVTKLFTSVIYEVL